MFRLYLNQSNNWLSISSISGRTSLAKSILGILADDLPLTSPSFVHKLWSSLCTVLVAANWSLKNALAQAELILILLALVSTLSKICFSLTGSSIGDCDTHFAAATLSAMATREVKSFTTVYVVLPLLQTFWLFWN